MAEIITCGQIIEPFVEAASTINGFPNFQIIGGNGSAALVHPKTELDLVSGLIIAPEGCDLPVHRDDGTLRDMDVLVLSSDEADLAAVEGLSDRTVGKRLQRSIFGLKPVSDLRRQQRHPISASAKVFLSDRYVELDSNGGVRYGYKALFPFAAPINADSLATLLLISPTGDRTPVPTSHPGATILNYLTRSISGLRPKDAEKVAKMADNILPRYPEVREWIYDGPGKPTLELARVLQTLRTSRRNPQSLSVGEYLHIMPYSYEYLARSAEYIGRSGSAARSAVAAARCKSRAVGFGESFQPVVTFWQKNVETKIDRIVHNR